MDPYDYETYSAFYLIPWWAIALALGIVITVIVIIAIAGSSRRD